MNNGSVLLNPAELSNRKAQKANQEIKYYLKQ